MKSLKQWLRKPGRVKWLCYLGAAAVGIWLGLAALMVTSPQLNREAPMAATETEGRTEQTEPVQLETLPAEETLPWNLLLVNPWNPIPEGFTVELMALEDGHAVDARAGSSLQEMMTAMDAQGLDPYICSSYRTEEKQQALFRNKVDYYLGQGYSLAQADAEAGKWVAVPGTSEHQTGLAVDIIDTAYPYLDEGQADTAVQQWLMAHCWEYGFILRYPGDKTEITGIYYEPWHYRYVGREAAKEIYEQGICLEEYLENRKAAP